MASIHDDSARFQPVPHVEEPPFLVCVDCGGPCPPEMKVCEACFTKDDARSELRALTADERDDVGKAVRGLKQEIAHWAHIRRHFGRMESDRSRGYRHPAVELQGYVRASRADGIAVMPAIRDELEAYGIQVTTSKTIYSKEERARARWVLAAARTS